MMRRRRKAGDTHNDKYCFQKQFETNPKQLPPFHSLLIPLALIFPILVARLSGWEWHVWCRAQSWRWCLHHREGNPFGIKNRNAIFLWLEMNEERSLLISRWRIFLPLVNIDPWLKRSEFRIIFPPLHFYFPRHQIAVFSGLELAFWNFKLSPKYSLLFNFLSH